MPRWARSSGLTKGGWIFYKDGNAMFTVSPLVSGVDNAHDLAVERLKIIQEIEANLNIADGLRNLLKAVPQ